jgi:hypothetical protein
MKGEVFHEQQNDYSLPTNNSAIWSSLGSKKVGLCCSAYSLHLLISFLAYSSALKMDVQPSETSVDFCRNGRYCNEKNRTPSRPTWVSMLRDKLQQDFFLLT